MRCSSLPQSERPRERLFQRGPGALGLHELLAILLRTGTKERDVLTLSAFIVEEFGSLQGLLRAHPEEFRKIPGCGPAKAALLGAAMEIARRVLAECSEEGVSQGKDWELRLRALAKEVLHEEREFLWALFLDSREILLGEDCLSYGGLSGAFLDMPALLRRAVRLGAKEIVLVHNHPGGDTEPSKEDQELTKLVAGQLSLLGMELKNHYVLGGGSYTPIESTKS